MYGINTRFSFRLEVTDNQWMSHILTCLVSCRFPILNHRFFSGWHAHTLLFSQALIAIALMRNPDQFTPLSSRVHTFFNHDLYPSLVSRVSGISSVTAVLQRPHTNMRIMQAFM